MKKIKKLINNLRVWYYDYMTGFCMEQWEYAHLEYDESHKKCTRWIKRYEKYERKLHTICPEAGDGL